MSLWQLEEDLGGFICHTYTSHTYSGEMSEHQPAFICFCLSCMMTYAQVTIGSSNTWEHDEHEFLLVYVGEISSPGQKSGRAPLRCTPAAQHVCIWHVSHPLSKGTVGSGDASVPYCTKSICTAQHCSSGFILEINSPSTSCRQQEV